MRSPYSEESRAGRARACRWEGRGVRLGYLGVGVRGIMIVIAIRRDRFGCLRLGEGSYDEREMCVSVATSRGGTGRERRSASRGVSVYAQRYGMCQCGRFVLCFSIPHHVYLHQVVGSCMHLYMLQH